MFKLGDFHLPAKLDSPQKDWMELNPPLTSYHPTLETFRKGQNRWTDEASWLEMQAAPSWWCHFNASPPWKTCLLFVVIPCAVQKVRYGQMPWCFWIAPHFFKQKSTSTNKNPCIHPFKRWIFLGKWMRRNWKAWGFCHGIHLLPCLPFPFPTSSIIFAFPKLKKLCGSQAPVNKINRHGTCSI